VSSEAWTDALEYLRLLGGRDYLAATDLLDGAIDRDGMAAISDAFADVCRALMDRVVFPAGTIDVHAVVDDIAMRVVEASGDGRREALDRQRSLVVFLGSDGLPCAARNDVASWDATDRLHDLIACTLGLLASVADDTGCSIAEVVWTIQLPPAMSPAEGAFTLAWRGPNAAEPLAGVVPRGYTAHITFLGEEPCSLRAIFGRVAALRDVAPADLPFEQHSAP
jgi:hypothetical protein